MEELSIVLQKYREETSDLKEVLDSYEEIETIYRASLEAMGWDEREAPQVKSTADVTLSFTETVNQFAQ